MTNVRSVFERTALRARRLFPALAIALCLATAHAAVRPVHAHAAPVSAARTHGLAQPVPKRAVAHTAHVREEKPPAKGKAAKAKPGAQKPAKGQPSRPAARSSRHKSIPPPDPDAQPLMKRAAHTAAPSHTVAPEAEAQTSMAPEAPLPFGAHDRSVHHEASHATGGGSAVEATPSEDQNTTQPPATLADFLAADKSAPPLTPPVSAPLHATRVRVVASTKAAQTLMPADRKAEARIIDAAVTPQLMPKLEMLRGRLVTPPAMKGSRDVLVHQNAMADSEGLERIADDDALDRMVASHQLLAMATSAALDVNPELPANRRYARPWTVAFVNDISRAFAARFGAPLRLNSAVRTVEYQLRLERVNGNAATTEGETASPHLTGQAIDFGKRGMTAQQIAWMRQVLAPLMDAGKIDVEEEFQQACFHISVYRSYLPARRAARTELAKATAPAKHAEETPDALPDIER